MFQKIKIGDTPSPPHTKKIKIKISKTRKKSWRGGEGVMSKKNYGKTRKKQKIKNKKVAAPPPSRWKNQQIACGPN